MRKATIERQTSETSISINLQFDGNGKSHITTGIPFFDHMLSSLSKHSGFDVQIKCVGDIEIDFHHTVEDVGIAFGEAFLQAIGNKVGIERFGEAHAPLDEALTRAVLDISGRPFLHFGLKFTRPDDGNGINPYLFEEFFRGFVNSGRITLHLDSIRGDNSHHILESAFKALAKALKKAVTITGTEIPSTKGLL